MLILLEQQYKIQQLRVSWNHYAPKAYQVLFDQCKISETDSANKLWLFSSPQWPMALVVEVTCSSNRIYLREIPKSMYFVLSNEYEVQKTIMPEQHIGRPSGC